jgi:hypothetical protein
LSPARENFLGYNEDILFKEFDMIKKLLKKMFVILFVYICTLFMAISSGATFWEIISADWKAIPALTPEIIELASEQIRNTEMESGEKEVALKIVNWMSL